MVMALAGSSSLFVLLLLVFESASFVYPPKKTEDEQKRAEVGEAAEEEEAMIRELAEIQKTRDTSQLEEMIRALVRRRIGASEMKKSHVEDTGYRVDFASSNKYVRKAYEDDPDIQPLPDYFAMP